MPDATKLAVFGGEPAVPQRVLSPSPQHGRPVQRAVNAALRSAPHDLGDPDSSIIAGLEGDVAAYHESRHAVALGDTTQALWLALAALDAGPGRSVIVSELGGAAVAHAVLMTGARPIACDVDPRTGNLDPAAVVALVDETTTAIVVTHTYGMPADLHELSEIADDHSLALIDDARDAFGAQYRSKPVGAAYADATVLSAHAFSPLAARGGALVVTDDAAVAAALRRHTQLDIPWEQPDADGPAYWPGFFGNAIPMSPLDAAVARARLPLLDPALDIARENARILVHGLVAVPGVTPPVLFSDRRATHQAFPLILDPHVVAKGRNIDGLRGHIVQALRAEGVPAGAPSAPVSQLLIMQTAEQRHLAAAGAEQSALPPSGPSAGPVAAGLVNDTVLIGVPPCPLQAQTHRAVDHIVNAAHKVFANLELLLELG